MAGIDKSKYRIIEYGGREYILVSNVPDYAKEYFGAPFGIPSYRLIRHNVTQGILKRPERLGRETYFKLSYIIGAITIIRLMRKWTTNEQLGKIILNTDKLNKFAETSDLVGQALDELSGDPARQEFVKQLMTKDPKEINLKKIAKEFPNTGFW